MLSTSIAAVSLVAIASATVCLCGSTLRILTILPYNLSDFPYPPSWNGGHDIVPAMNLAVEMINNRQDILPECEMELVNENGGCNFVNAALISFTSRVIQPGSQIAGLIGPGCSASTLAVLPLVNREQVTLINIHGAGSHLVENRTLYPNSLGILGSTRDFAHAVFALMRCADWFRVAALFEESRTYFFSIYQALLSGIRSETNGTVIFDSPVYSTYYPLSEIRDSGLRIIVVMAGPTLTQNIMCLAYHENMLYPDYQWILVSREVSEFSDFIMFTYDGKQYSCSLDLLTDTILRGNLLLNYQLRTLNSTTVTHSGLNFIEFSEQYKAKLNEYNHQNSVSAFPSVWAPMYFDAIWALALAFNSTDIDMSSYRRGNAMDSAIIRDALYSLGFDGVSGRISFNHQTGFVNRRINIYQVFNGKQSLIGFVNDGSVQKVQHPEYIPDEFESPHKAALPAIVIFTMVTVTLAVLVVVMHITTIVYQKHASIKATSNSLNHFVYCGCYLWIAAILLNIVYHVVDRQQHPEVAANVCQAIWAWLFPIAYTLIIGTVSARTWRLYRIFTHYLNPGPLISNRVLIGFILLLLTIDVILASGWTIVDPLQIGVTNGIDSADKSVANSREALTISIFGCNSYFVWALIIYAFKIALLIMATILTLLTLNIHNRNFTTKFLRVFVYLFVLLFALSASLLHLSYRVPASFTVFSVCSDAVVFLMLVLIFFPPVWPIVSKKCESVH